MQAHTARHWNDGEFSGGNGWMAFDGTCGLAKTAVSYDRMADGEIEIGIAREGEMCRLP